MKKEVSFVILVDILENLDRKIEQISKIENCELIIIGTKENKNEIQEKYDCIYIEDDMVEYSTPLNKAIRLAKGRLINFSFSSSLIEEKTIKEIIKKDYNIVHLTNKKINSEIEIIDKYPLKSKNRNIIKNEKDFDALIDGYFYNRKKIERIKFEKNLGKDVFAKFVICTLYRFRNYKNITNGYCYYSNYSTFNPMCEEANTSSWYTESMKKFVIPTLKEYPYQFTKNIMLTLVISKLELNIDTKNKHVLNSKESIQFLKSVKEFLNLIDDETIIKYKNKILSEEHKKIIFEMKYNMTNQKNLLDTNGNIVKNNLVINKYNNYSIEVLAINNFETEIVFDVAFSGLHLINNGAKIVPEIDEKKLKIKVNQVYSKTKFFDIDCYSKYTFSVSINKKDIKNDSRLQFMYNYNGNYEPLKIVFSSSRTQARLTEKFSKSYWQYEKNKLITRSKYTLLFKNVNNFYIVKREILLMKEFLQKSKKKKLGIQATLLRLLYWITKKHYSKKRIWVTFDKLYKGGDNGEYFYQYCLNNKDNIECYYIINESSHDYERLKNNKNILKFKSIKEYLVVLNAECVFATHAKHQNFLAFTSGKEKYFRDLMNYDVHCIQHGLTIQDIPHIQNRLYDNTKLYFCASEFEIKNIEKEEYDYKGYNYIKKTGIPRFDGLKDKSKKQILITPTWRSNMANTKTVMGGTRPYYDKFKETPYFQIYNKLINDEKLIECAKELGYKIVYLIHPTLTAQIVDYTKNDYVDIYCVTEDQSYEKLLTESALMVTDYSGVQYDFAYMKKPILYYHPDLLPPHYGDGGIDYKNDGFGEIIKEHSDLVDKLCCYMINDCRNDDKYIKRDERFFIYDDFNNCKRIYEETLKYENKDVNK